MVSIAPSARLNQFFRISRLLAGQLDFRSAIRAVAAEIAQIIPHDHIDVCILGVDGQIHTAYEFGIDTYWVKMHHAPVANSPIRALLVGEVDHILFADACAELSDLRDETAFRPIFEHDLHSRIHLPMIVHGEIIGALSCSLHAPNKYGREDVKNARYIAELLSPYFFALRAAEQARQSAIVETEARGREEGLRLGALKLTEVLEQERQRIGMDLHDQTLADLTRLARRLDRMVGADRLEPDELKPVLRSLQMSMHALRHIIEEARPSVLELFGFGEAVENHLDRAIRDSAPGTKWTLNDNTDGAIDALSTSVAIALFRITQEAVNNAVSHAQATAITVDLARTADQIVIAIRDNGIGIGNSRGRAAGTGYGTGHGSGTGIDNMKTRARLISARFAITSSPKDGGTLVSITLPFVARKSKARKVHS